MNISYTDNPSVIITSQIIGYIAGATVVLINIPQTFLIFKNKSSDDVSLLTIIINLISGMLFLTYGILIYQLPLIICNFLYILVTIILIYAKFKFKSLNKCFKSFDKLT